MLVDEIEVDVQKTADNIKKFMKKQKLSRSELGRKTGLTRGCISNYTNGYNPPSLTNLGVIAEVLNVGIGDIVVYKRKGSIGSDSINAKND